MYICNPSDISFITKLKLISKYHINVSDSPKYFINRINLRKQFSVIVDNGMEQEHIEIKTVCEFK